MKIKWWQYLWSYISDVHVESISSKYNEYLHVCISKGRFQLLTPNAIYSYADKYDNFKLTFDKIHLPSDDTSPVLVLGLGLGSIPYMLENVYQKKYEYTCVEIDPSVIQLASKYVIPDLSSDMQIIQADAQAFVCMTSELYSLICVDIFVDDKIPETFLDRDFLLDLDDILAPDGIILFNHLSMTKNDRKKAESYFDTIFGSHYPNATSLLIKGNRIMINDKICMK